MVINLRKKSIVKIYLKTITAIFAVVLIGTSIASFLTGDPNYVQWNWFVYVGTGALAIFGLLMHTMKLQKPKDFSKLHIWEFFALSVLVVSLVMGVVLFPTQIFPTDMPIKKIIVQDLDKNKEAEWVISIGGIKDSKGSSGMEIPIYILVAGNIGAYIRYLYGYIKDDMKQEREWLEKLKDLYLLQKKIINTLCIAAGLKYELIQRNEDTDMITLKHIHKHYDNNRKLIFFLPPQTVGNLAQYVSLHFNKLYRVESDYEVQQFLLRIEVYKRTIKTIAAFFLAPLLAIIAWLLLDLSGTDNWQAFAVTSFSAGLASNAIIQRIWMFMGEQFNQEESQPKKPKDELKKEESE